MSLAARVTRTRCLQALLFTLGPSLSRLTNLVACVRIRYYDSESAVVWNELERGRPIKLVPVEDISSDRRISELTGLQRAYVSDPPYVFLHASEADDPTDGVVVWAIRPAPESALIHAVSSAPIADTIAAIALSLPVESVFFVWQPRRLSLMRHYALRFLGRRSAVPLDVRWLLRRNSPKVFIRTEPSRQEITRPDHSRDQFREKDS